GSDSCVFSRRPTRTKAAKLAKRPTGMWKSRTIWNTPGAYPRSSAKRPAKKWGGTSSSCLNVKTDRRRDRRPLTVGELTHLLEATRRGPDREDMNGQERAILYLLAVETGLRSNELALHATGTDGGKPGPKNLA